MDAFNDDKENSRMQMLDAQRVAEGINDDSIAFRNPDGGSIDIGADADVDDETDNSEEERERLFGNDASNKMSWTLMNRNRD